MDFHLGAMESIWPVVSSGVEAGSTLSASGGKRGDFAIKANYACKQGDHS